MKLYVVLFSCVFLSGCEFIKVDKCLDGGGRWDYEKEICDFGKQEDKEQNE